MIKPCCKLACRTGAFITLKFYQQEIAVLALYDHWCENKKMVPKKISSFKFASMIT
jgi:hypothetical protein